MFNTTKLTLWARFCLYATATAPFLLWAKFTFPYVTVRTAIFRIAIEAALIIFMVLLARRQERLTSLRHSLALWVMVALFLVELAAAWLGESFSHSFWGDLERMWGLFTVGHFILFYLLLRSFLRERAWRVWWHVSFVTSLLVSLYGIVQRNPEFFGVYLFQAGVGRIPSTLGNPTYVAIYLLFNIALALYFISRAENRRWRYFYWAVAVVDFYALTLTDIRGAYLGFLAAFVVAGVLYLILGQKQTVKLSLAGLFVAALLVLTVAVRYKSSDFIQSIPILRRVVSISLKDETAQTRFIGWNAAWRGFLEDPLTGAGMENYNIVFNKYFQARYYNFAPTETYFDRAHNQYFNILAESGILALLLYFGLPFSIGYYLLVGFRRGVFDLRTVSIFGGLAVAYFIHLFFVFDEINTLLMFVAYLAFVEFLFYRETLLTSAESGPEKQKSRLVLVAPIIIFIVYLALTANVNVLRAAHTSALAYLTTDMNNVIANYRAALGVGIVPTENLVLNYADYLVSLGNSGERIRSNEEKLNLAGSAFSEAAQALAKEIEKKPKDAFLYLKLGQLNNSWYLVDENKSHLSDAVPYFERALALSPERLQIHYLLGESLVLAGEDERAIEVLKQPTLLNPQFRASYYYLGRAYLANNQFAEAYDTIVNKGFFERGYDPEDNAIAFALADEAARRGEYDKVAVIYEYLFKLEPKNVQLAAALTAAYVNADRFDEAASTARRAAELDPEFATEANFIIQMINEGRFEELKKATR